MQRAQSVIGDEDDPGRAKLALELQKETVATCLKAITRAKVPLVTKPASDAGKPAILDETAMLEAIRHDDAAWLKLSYQDLITEGELDMFELLSDSADWNAVQNLIGSVSNPTAKSPFAGRARMLSVE
jgi:hypothetical protein